ncbi:hypothetical protein [Roseicella aerolata]|uniref:Uncharacterized protein n=1 Tax=Roseicella aerolata TaxID=2883479 RepID=A0A9X1L9I7_9PROT|nr:hypothetical protein [Roseicella aerolata]MCB4821168.1 hypothetical protein [Roseicella aerolata]
MDDDQTTQPPEPAPPEALTLPGFGSTNGVDHRGQPVVLSAGTAATLAEHDLLLGRTRRLKQRAPNPRAWS